MSDPTTDFAHSSLAQARRHSKALVLARFLWNRGITVVELTGFDAGQRRKLARAADVAPPSSDETWKIVTELLNEKTAWAASHPDHPAAAQPDMNEKIMWVKRTPRSYL